MATGEHAVVSSSVPASRTVEAPTHERERHAATHAVVFVVVASLAAVACELAHYWGCR